MPDTRTARIELNEHGVVRVRINDGAPLALLVEASPFGRMFGNVYLRIANPGVPTRLFSDETEAAGWLDGHRR